MQRSLVRAAVVSAIAAILILAGCTTPPAQPSGDAAAPPASGTMPARTDITVSAGEASNGKTVEVKVGDKLGVTLEGNPTTGFSWMVEGEAPPFLRLEGEPEYTPLTGDTKVVGSGGTFLFVFDVKDAGSGTLRLAYRRPWESSAPERTYTLEIVAK